MKRLLAATVLAAALAGRLEPVRAQSASPTPETEALVARERVRTQVETILSDLYQPRPEHAENDDLFESITSRLVALGPDVVPLMEAELENRSRFTFNIAAYVLGFLQAPGAAEIFKREAEVADREGTEFGRDRKLWLGYAAGMMGDPSAVDILDSGGQNAIRRQIFEEFPVIEAVAVLTAPACRTRILDRLEPYSADPQLQERLYHLLRALSRIAEPSLVPRVLPFLSHEKPYVRDAAARVLAATGDPAVADPLLARLAEDTDPFARFGIASALEQIRPAGKAKKILAILEQENSTPVRGALYRTLGLTEGDGSIEAFVRLSGREDALDRYYLMDAAARTGSRKAVNLLRGALTDADLRPVLRAVDGLASIGGGGPMDTVLALLRDPRWPVELAATTSLLRVGERRAAPRIADRLRSSIAAPVTDPTRRDEIRARGDALVALRDTSCLADVRKSLDIQPDPELLSYLEGLARRMSALEERKADPAKWIEALSSEDAELRKLAISRLAEIPGKASVEALSASFGRVETDEGVEILRSLAQLGSQDAAPLLERILMDPAFDSSSRAPLRSMAAWAARRIGGEKMTDALRRSAERREGADANVLVYLAVASGRKALPLLESLRAPRLRYWGTIRGKELERLDWLAREIAAGRPVASLDRPPDQIPLH